MPTLPALDIKLKVNNSPHVVIVGAGASVAACPRGDRYGRRVPVMANLIEVLGFEHRFKEAGLRFELNENFERLYERIASDDRLTDLRDRVDKSVREYFEALQLPDDVTIYDRLLLTLRPKDLIASLNWDPFLLQAYARNRELRDLPMVVFLHGNVYLGHCAEHKAKGYSTQVCNTCQRPLQPSPLLFPVSDKDYRSHPLVASEWQTLLSVLDHAYIVTIFGYAAPVSDAAARDILFKAWAANETRELAIVEVIDILGRRVLESRWKDFTVRHSVGALKRFNQAFQCHYPRRSCEAYAFASLQQAPWSERPLPRFRRLRHLQDWVVPLIEEERALETDHRPFTPFTALANQRLQPTAAGETMGRRG
jgi:hypothetical protein